MTVQADGHILAIGEDDNGWGAPQNFVSVRLEPDGNLDPTYGTDGLVLKRTDAVVAHSARSHARAGASSVARRADGSHVLVGPTTPDFVSGTDVAMAIRYLPDGSVDPSWSSDGILEVAGVSTSLTTDSAFQPDERVILATRENGDVQLRRLLGFEPCGNGLLDPWETCDDGNTLAGDCCSPTCQLDAAGVACGGDASGCTSDTCDGLAVCEHPNLLDGQSCNDGDLCKQAGSCSGGSCIGVAEPATTCRRADAGSLVLRNIGGTKDTLTWVWKKGDWALLSEIPEQPYSPCLFEGGSASLMGSVDTPGLPCGPDHCFKTSAKKTTYTSKTTAFDGVKRLILRAGEDGKATVKLKGKGAHLPMPLLPLLPLLAPVVAQLHGENGTCFEATCSAPSRNDAFLFQAKAD